MKHQVLFFRKIKLKIIKVSSAAILLVALRVKIIPLTRTFDFPDKCLLTVFFGGYLMLGVKMERDYVTE